MVTELTLPTSCAQGAFWSREADQDLVCIDVRQETHNVRTFTFRAKQERYFGFEPGQYFLFDFEIDGETHSRCYSMSSSALAPRAFSITVKRVDGGKVSNWLHDHLKPGGMVRGTGPTGTFTLPDPGEGPYLFVSGGSGITPVMSMVRALADARRHPDIVFVHAARTPADLVFRDELLYRAKVTPNFRLLFLPERAGNETGWSGLTGRVSEALLKVAVPDLAQRTVMCCGPAPFMKAMRELSLALGVPQARYFEESFDAAVLDEETVTPAPAAQAASAFKVTFAKQSKVIDVSSEQSVLAAARQGGVRLPSSCSNGLCGTCKSKLVSGSVDMKHNGGIRQREVDAGFFLPCCSKPLSDLVIDR
ncbi:hybrid-cluster NAD(P)-dependent oxidoreductase [Azohydromonas australica]|uniref:hybrid-cluster NAD(P)-dependent oxidoreductase n=1 Tax=Azohydromonas australica TaxID=364039 RepID=UPI0004266932|nr:hybrid-cluster NAD(P)-dependent oxidoreductase [Azohydromonas australica]